MTSLLLSKPKEELLPEAVINKRIFMPCDTSNNLSGFTFGVLMRHKATRGNMQNCSLYTNQSQ